MTYRAMLLVVLLSLPGALLSVLAYHSYAAPMPMGMVDVTRIWKSGQTATVQALVRPDSTDEQRRAALAESQKFGERMQEVIHQVAKECRCVLVTSSAVLDGSIPDYSGLVEQRLATPGKVIP